MENVTVKVLETCGGFDEGAGEYGQYFVYTSGEHTIPKDRYDMIKGANVLLISTGKGGKEKRPDSTKTEKRVK